MAATTVLEPAIPPHLQTQRTIPAKTPANYQPPFPAYSARFPEKLKGLVVAIVGIQCESSSNEAFKESHSRLQSFFQAPSKTETWRPHHWIVATVTDNRGFFNWSTIAYWQTVNEYNDWTEHSGFEAYWRSLDPTDENMGWFREVFLPPVERFETVFSDNKVPEGAAHMREGVSGEIREHVYWGSMRDRLPVAQHDALNKGTSSSANGFQIGEDTQKKRIKVPGRQNLAVIRSGQDWSGTTPHERKLYLETMHPVLIKGMEFLRDHGEEVGCLSCRFQDVIDNEAPDATTDKTFGLAYFDNLSSLERWSREHKTHLDIFGRFLQYAQELQGNVSLKLFHEVFVLEPQQQSFEYVGCHSGTGMLASL